MAMGGKKKAQKKKSFSRKKKVSSSASGDKLKDIPQIKGNSTESSEWVLGVSGRN